MESSQKINFENSSANTATNGGKIGVACVAGNIVVNYFNHNFGNPAGEPLVDIPTISNEDKDTISPLKSADNNFGKKKINVVVDDIFNAVKKGDEKAITKFIESGGNVNLENDNGYSLILIAANYGHLSIIKYLKKNGGNIHVHVGHFQRPAIQLVDNSRPASYALNFGKWNCSIGDTPIFEATKKGHLNIIKYLIDHGVDIEAKNNSGLNLLQCAAKFGHFRCVQYLIEEQGFYVNKDKNYLNMSDKFYCNPINEAIENGYFKIIKYLVQCGADIFEIGKEGFTPIHIAAKNGHLNVIKFLISNKADMHNISKREETALHIAIKNNKIDCAKYLIETGLDVNSKDKYGVTALFYAIEHSCYELVEYLVNSGADVHCKGKFESTALHLAARCETGKCVRFLIDEGLDVNAKDDYEETPLFYAANYGKSENISILIEAGANYSFKNNLGKTPLYVASINGKLNSVKCLVEHGADINPTDEEGDTPLHTAAKYGYLDVLECLVINGADRFAKNKSGKTALGVAIDCIQTKCENFLYNYNL